MRMGSNTVKSMKIYVELWEWNKKVQSVKSMVGIKCSFFNNFQ